MQPVREQYMDVSVIIVNYNTTALTEQCITSVLHFTGDLSYEIIVIDNASPDRSIENITQRFPKLQLINNSVNAGFGSANNIGIRAARGEFVFLLNSDTQLVSDAISFFLAYMRKPENSRVAVCGGELYTGTERSTASFGNFPGLLQAISSIGFLYLYRPYYRRHIDIGVANYNEEVKQVDFISGADMFIRRSVLDEVGLFDESFFLYFEETELSHRISKKGYRSMLLPAVKIIHHEGSSEQYKEPGSFNYNSFRYYTRSRQLFFRKVHGVSMAAAVKPFFIIATIIKSIAGKEKGRLLKKLWILITA